MDERDPDYNRIAGMRIKNGGFKSLVAMKGEFWVHRAVSVYGDDAVTIMDELVVECGSRLWL